MLSMYFIIVEEKYDCTAATIYGNAKNNDDMIVKKITKQLELVNATVLILNKNISASTGEPSDSIGKHVITQ